LARRLASLEAIIVLACAAFDRRGDRMQDISVFSVRRTHWRETVRVLAFAASLRSGSSNRKLIRLAAEIARTEGAEVDLAEFREFDMPLYDADLEGSSGLPAGARELARRVEAAAALMISVPEYNYSIPGTLKNAFDWVSRVRPMPWRGRSVYLMSASPSPIGGIRGLWHARVPFEGCGALVFPDMFALPSAHQAFDEDGRLRDPKLAARLAREVCGFVRLSLAVTPLCSEHASGKADPGREKIVAALEDQSEIQSAGK
jgi:NAD(P)H-dependent FMN reductase